MDRAVNIHKLIFAHEFFSLKLYRCQMVDLCARESFFTIRSLNINNNKNNVNGLCAFCAFCCQRYALLFNALFASFSDFPLFLPFCYIHRMFFCLFCIIAQSNVSIYFKRCKIKINK